MFKNAYQQFVADNIKLVKTMTIKSVDTAERINDLIRLKYGTGAVDSYDESTWKYYKNIAGEYHRDDVLMRVLSVDTLEEIDFTKNSLKLHPATMRAYQHGTNFYKLLVKQYPYQESLILGILYPVDLETAIDAENHTILTYPEGLVESQEITLVRDLQKWLYLYTTRWNVRAFSNSDSLYPVAQHGVMVLNMVPKLLNLRSERCKTNEAHSFHIRQYLASHNRLDLFMDYMTLKQQLWLYRNLPYLERNAGKAEVFNWLLSHLFTDRYIPVSEFSARHLNRFNTEFQPEYLFRKKPLNTQYNIPEKNYFMLDELLQKEFRLAKDNETYAGDHFKAIDQQFRNSSSSVVQTKDLESVMVDYTGAVPYPITVALMMHWAYMSANRLYTAVCGFRDQVSGINYSMGVQDAFVFMRYCTLKAVGIDTPFVYPQILTKVQRRVKPSAGEIAKVAGKQYQPKGVADWIVQNQPTMLKVSSTSAFFEFGSAVADAALKQWYLLSQTENLSERGMVANMVNQMYCDTVVKFDSDGEDMQTWLRIRNLDVADHSPEDLMVLASNIFTSATGFSVNPTRLVKNIQAAMVAIFTQLSSYSIQFIKSINTEPIIPLNWSMIRIGDITSFQSQCGYLQLPLGVVKTKAISGSKHFLDLTITGRRKKDNGDYVDDIEEVQYAIHKKPVYNISLATERNAKLESVAVILLSRVECSIVDNPYGYDSLTEEQRRSISDIYHPKLDLDYQPRLMNIADTITINKLPDLQWSGGNIKL